MSNEGKIDPTTLWSKVPWATPDEFKELRDCLLSNQWQEVKRGLEQVEVWKKAGEEVPFKVEATCFLLRALLRDPENTPCSQSIDALGGAFSSVELESAYALAIVRVVSSVVDPIRRQVPVNMEVIAEKQGLSSSCMELRHGIVHNKMASLEKLQHGAKECLAYLSKHFWDGMCEWFKPSKSKVEKELREFFSFRERLGRRRARKSGSRIWGKRLRDSSSEGEENLEDGNGNPEEMNSLKRLEVQKQVMCSSASIQALTHASVASVATVLLEKFSPQDHLQGLEIIIELCPNLYSALLEQFVEGSAKGKQAQGHWFGWLSAGRRCLSLLSKADLERHVLHLIRSCHPSTPTQIISEGGAGILKGLLGCLLDSASRRGYLSDIEVKEIAALADGLLSCTGKMDQSGKRRREDPGYISLVAAEEEEGAGSIGLDDIEASEERERKLRKLFEGRGCQKKKEIQETVLSKENTGGREVLLRRMPSSFEKEKNSSDCPPAPTDPNLSSPATAPGDRNLKFCGNLMYTNVDVVGDAYCRGVPADCKTVGFDVEWRPQYEKGKPQRKAALVQLCYSTGKEDRSKYDCILVHVFHSGVPEGLKILLANPDIKKVGVNVLGDARKLELDYKIEVEGCVDISTEAMTRVLPASPSPEQSIQKLKSLQGLCEVLLGMGLAKGKAVRCGNWESLPLSEAQRTYAATDAYASLKCYEALLDLPKAEIPSVEPQELPVTGDDGVAGYIPEIASVRYLPPSKHRTYEMFMGTGSIRKHTIMEIFRVLKVKPATVLAYLSSAILSGRGYDWKRLGVEEEAVVSVGQVLLEKLFPEEPDQKERRTDAQEEGKENGALAAEGAAVEKSASGCGDGEILDELVGRIREKLGDAVQPNSVVDFLTLCKKKQVGLKDIKESLSVDVEFCEIQVALAHLARLVGVSHQGTTEGRGGVELDRGQGME